MELTSYLFYDPTSFLIGYHSILQFGRVEASGQMVEISTRTAIEVSLFSFFF